MPTTINQSQKPTLREDTPASSDLGMVVRQAGALPAGANIIGQVGIASFPTGTLTNGAETAVGAVAISILAANANRKTAIIQNTGVANIRVGVVGVTATTGFRLQPNESIIYDMPFVPIQDIFAIREGAISSTAFTQEVT